MENIAPDNALIICHAAARLLLNHQGAVVSDVTESVDEYPFSWDPSQCNTKFTRKYTFQHPLDSDKINLINKSKRSSVSFCAQHLISFAHNTKHLNHNLIIIHNFTIRSVDVCTNITSQWVFRKFNQLKALCNDIHAFSADLHKCSTALDEL